MDERLAIHQAKTTFREAYNRGDADQVLSVFGDGFTNMSSDFPSYWNREAREEMRHRLSLLFAGYLVQLVVIPIVVAFEGALAYDYGWHEFKFTAKQNGAVTLRRERYFETWRKNDRGEWKIDMYFTNVDVPETTVFSVAS